MFRSLRDNLAFFQQFRQRFETTGAIAPSSRFLAKSMVRYLARRGEESVRVLEIGPGTGPVTRQIIPLIRSGDRLDIVELNESFVEILNGRFQSDPEWKQAAGFSEIHQLPVQEFQPEQKYDFVISGLPLNNFPADLVELISNAYFDLLKPGGVLSYFEYMFVRPIRKTVTRGDERIRISRIDEIMQAHCDRHRIQRDSIWVNVPPAWVQHLKFTGPDPGLG
ncbi:MAG: methyltransferase domain-containing protein [Fuerstiella sp.]